MQEQQVKIVFGGEIREGFTPETVKQNLCKLLKIDADQVNQLFSGAPVTLKSVPDRKVAQKYLMALHKAGAVCQVESAAPSAGRPGGELATKPPARPAAPPPDPVEEMIRCPACNYRQKPAPKCIMCGADFAGDPPHTGAPPSRPPGTGTAEPVRSDTRSAPGKPLPPLGDTMVLTNIEYIPGREIVEHFGLVSGSTIRAKHIGKDILASFKNLVGGELKGYTQLLQESRDEAVERMTAQARQLGANAVINVRFSTSSLAQGAAELYAYGTAVRVE